DARLGPDAAPELPAGACHDVGREGDERRLEKRRQFFAPALRDRQPAALHRSSENKRGVLRTQEPDAHRLRQAADADGISGSDGRSHQVVLSAAARAAGTRWCSAGVGRTVIQARGRKPEAWSLKSASRYDLVSGNRTIIDGDAPGLGVRPPPSPASQ